MVQQANSPVSSLHKIVLDCERMKYPYTGIYYYCLHLGKALLRQQDPLTENCSFYLPAAAGKVFGDHPNYLNQHSLDKFVFPSLKPYQIWHSTFQGTNYFPATRKIKIVFTVHDLNFLHDQQMNRSKKYKYLKQLEKKIRRADHITAISQFALNDLRQVIDTKNKPCSVIYNGCNVQEIELLKRPASAPSTPFLFTIGTIAEKKNFHIIPALLKDNHLRLIIAGINQNESYRQRILKEAAKWNASDRVFFAGAVSENDKQWYFKNCKAFIFPSLAEGFGLPVVEAMYYGKPTFLSTCTSLPEVGGNLAYYFKNFDPADMRQVFEAGMHHFETANPKDAIQKWIADKYNWDKAALQYLEVYRSLY